jgi:hypothetical protein
MRKTMILVAALALSGCGNTSAYVYHQVDREYDDGVTLDHRVETKEMEVSAPSFGQKFLEEMATLGFLGVFAIAYAVSQ